MICVKSGYNSEQAFFDFDTNGSAAACYVDIMQKKILTVCCYNPPANSKFAYTNENLTRLFNDINQLTRKCDDIIVYGDFNFSTINWCSSSSENFSGREFLSIIEENNFQQKIDFNTAANGVLDLIMVSDNKECVNFKQMTSDECQINKLSNHYPI